MDMDNVISLQKYQKVYRYYGPCRDLQISLGSIAENILRAHKYCIVNTLDLFSIAEEM